MSERQVEVAIIGSGTSGLNALSRVKPSGKSFVLINGGELGTTCARVGCMPSKAVIQVAEDFHRRSIFNRLGIEGHEEMGLDIPEAMEFVQDLRDTFVDRVITNSTDRLSEEEFVQGYVRFLEPNLLELDNGDKIRADRIVIATGSRPIIPNEWQSFSDKVITSDEFFDLEDLPKSVAVIGLGVIGLEIGQALSRLGIQVTGIDAAQNIGGLTDPEVAQVAAEVIGKEMPLWLGGKPHVEQLDDGMLCVRVGEQNVIVEKIFAAIGRLPNIERLGLKEIGVATNERGIPLHNPNTMQVGNLPIFIAGDVTGQRPILHEAGDEGKIAGYNAATGEIHAFKRKTPLAITFCDPNIVSVGAKYSELDLAKTAIGEIRLGPVGRAMIMAKNKGIIRVYADKASGKMLGAEMISVKGENLGHLLAWSIQQEMTVGDMLRMPFYHPVLEEALQAALNNLYAQVEGKNSGPITELEEL